MIGKLFMALAALAVAACTAPTPPTDTPATPTTFIGIDGRPLVSVGGIIDNSVQEALTANPAACAKAGGALQPVCRMQMPMCVITFSDAGKSCADGAQCGSGRCLAGSPTASTDGPGATGQCSPTNDPCGCYQRIVKGVAQPTLCAD
jgi:hypothetical protein